MDWQKITIATKVISILIPKDGKSGDARRRRLAMSSFKMRFRAEKSDLSIRWVRCTTSELMFVEISSSTVRPRAMVNSSWKR